MRKIMLAVALILGIAVNAQTLEKKQAPKQATAKTRAAASTPDQRADIRLNQLRTDLTLNDKQQKDVRKVLLTIENDRQKLTDANKAMRKSGKKLSEDERLERRTKNIEQRKTLNNELKKILTAEQYTKFEQTNVKKRETLRNGVRKDLSPSQN